MQNVTGKESGKDSGGASDRNSDRDSDRDPGGDDGEVRKRLERLLAARDNDAEITAALADEDADSISQAISNMPAEQIQRICALLDPDICAEVLTNLAPEEEAEAVSGLDAEHVSAVIDVMPPRDAASVIASAAPDLAEEMLARHYVPATMAADARSRRKHAPGTAGHLMTTNFVRLDGAMSVAEAIERMRRTDPFHDMPNNLYVVAPEGPSEGPPEVRRERLLGAISLRDLVMSDAGRPVSEVMETDLVTLAPEAADDEAAALLSRDKLLALPVTDRDGMLLGIIPADDAIGVVAARLRRLYAKSVGGDAEAMARMSPAEAARTRVPWLLGTIVLELGAGLVIAHFNEVLERVILLASFMPVISAVSGNVGLQAAAITVRALDTGRLSSLPGALLKETATALLMALVCGLFLGTIAMVWSHHVMLAAVIAISMVFSMLTAGLMGTLIPMVSRRLGFDPATTAGPFETAFQDVVGFAVFLGLATLMVDKIS
ncbi:magnesium transporter [Pontibaca methylaminivorans]|uniref:Magnesium transporter n=1 Tax=Pontibaca methylaminivorans TaxID=515897 RepID=A0A1R3X6T1_9RHOB|nr:magnesium transporter [Pontibaca methylaminivorans]SIT86603.1 magnesium transporter [Pontibaca methylaminivorans]